MPPLEQGKLLTNMECRQHYQTFLAASEGIRSRNQHYENMRTLLEKSSAGITQPISTLRRVGGRLLHSELPKAAKHPVLLKGNHNGETHTHAEFLHGGTQMILANIAETFGWFVKEMLFAIRIEHA